MRARWLRLSFPFIAFGATVAACATSGGGGAPVNSSFGNNGQGSSSPLAQSSSGATNIQVMSNMSGGNIVASTSASSDASGEACQHFDVQFTPRVPLVYVLVDGSGSMFTPPNDGGPATWGALRTAALNVIQSLQGQVDFGFGDYGSNGTVSAYTDAGYGADMCGILNNVSIAPMNYTAISAEYNSLNMQMYSKTNTPAFIALGQAAGYLGQAAMALAAQVDAGGPAVGGEYILLVTDGETDFCDDGNALCPIDAVTAEIQSLYSQGIQTLVLGLASDLTTQSGNALQDFANAGAGVAPAYPPPNPGQPPTADEFYEQCNSGGWAALYKSYQAAGGTGQSLATYAPLEGGAPPANAKLYTPLGLDVTDLTTQITAALSTVKSCSFDLQGEIQVDLALAGEGMVTIDGNVIPYVGDAGTDGWMMSSATELDLVGSACQTWQNGKNISFNFPCEILMSVIPR